MVQQTTAISGRLAHHGESLLRVIAGFKLGTVQSESRVFMSAAE